VADDSPAATGVTAPEAGSISISTVPLRLVATRRTSFFADDATSMPGRIRAPGAMVRTGPVMAQADAGATSPPDTGEEGAAGERSTSVVEQPAANARVNGNA
jgi:hypothetical protein